MPPTRGHDLKLMRLDRAVGSNAMPPTRGHDLKPVPLQPLQVVPQMPPTRGHDLKLSNSGIHITLMDAPHTGARLETHTISGIARGTQMPPTRGHDLKHPMLRKTAYKENDAPHTGARLETQVYYWIKRDRHDAPHTGARLETLP